MTTNHDYGYAGETNGLTMSGTAYHDQFATARTVRWTEKGLRITRFRILSDPGFPAWDVSYCHGFIGDEPVHVELPFSQLPKYGKGGWKGAVIEHAKRDGLYAKGLGIFDAASTLI